MYVPSIYQINFEQLKQKSINSIIIDLDNTLVESSQMHVPPQLRNWLKALQENQFKITIVSNNSKDRVSQFARSLDIPYIYAARKPLAIAFHKAMRIMESELNQTVVVGDQLLTDVLGGNRLGIYTILVVPVSEHEGWMTRVNRKLERMIFWWLRRRGYLKWGERR